MNKELYLSESDKLFTEWENDPFHDKKKFFRDGIVEYDYWESSPVKTMFLFKEAYTRGEDGYDLAKELSDSAPYGRWWRVPQWAYAIREVLTKGLKPAFPNDLKSGGDWDKGNDLLSSSAIVNIKKSKGESASKPFDLMNYTLHDQHRLQAQIDLIDPNVVYCGNTINYYKAIYPKDKLELIDNSSFIYNHKNRLVISYYHFTQHSWSDKEVFEEICEKLLKIKR
jgi:hypothetical protein